MFLAARLRFSRFRLSDFLRIWSVYEISATGLVAACVAEVSKAHSDVSALLGDAEIEIRRTSYHASSVPEGSLLRAPRIRRKIPKRGVESSSLDVCSS